MVSSFSLVCALCFLALANLTADQGAKVTLAWDPAPNETILDYLLLYGGSSGVYSNTIHTGTNTLAVVPGLTPGETYFFAVSAINQAGQESSLSEEAVYTVPFLEKIEISFLKGEPSQLDHIHLHLAGHPQHKYLLEQSLDLKRWYVIGTFTAPNTVVLTLPPSRTMRFYRFRRAQ